jgi:mono/diheme cytochrome c family protein
VKKSEQGSAGLRTKYLAGAGACLGAALLLLIPVASTGAGGTRAGSRPSSLQMTLQAAQGNPCSGISSDSGRLTQVLPGVPKYNRTYVLVISQKVSSQVTGPTSSALKGIEVGVDQGTPGVDAAKALGLAKVKMYDASSPLQPLTDMQAGNLDAAILWAPMAGAGLLDMNMDDKVSVYAVDRPLDPPSGYSSAATGAVDPCAQAISDDLDADGVLPAELLVSVNIRSFLGQHPGPEDMAMAKQGEAVFQQVCARCHGDHAVADKKALAPVDLLVSIRRFQFVGFKYIVLNGRPQRSMPPLRGTVTEPQVAQIYQYLRARSKGLLSATD